jgi:dGTP triphosphohydrolase
LPRTILGSERRTEDGTHENASGAADELSAEGAAQAAAQDVCDYVAGMTDNFILEQHRKLFPAKKRIGV